MKRAEQPDLSLEGQKALDQYASVLRREEDLAAMTIRNYLSDMRQFIAGASAIGAKNGTKHLLPHKPLHLLSSFATGHVSRPPSGSSLQASTGRL